MKTLHRNVFLLFFLCALIGLTSSHKLKEVPESPNPLLSTYNQPIQFALVKATHIKDATTQIIEKTETALAKIYSIKTGQHTFQNTMLAYDQAVDALWSITGTISLIASTSPDSLTRAEANNSSATLGKFINELTLNEQLYKTIKAYSLTQEAKNLVGYKKKFLDETVSYFERNGFSLTQQERKQLQKIQDKITELGIEFDKNIAEYKDSLLITEKEIEGLPEDYKKSRKVKGDMYTIDLSYPSYIPFMEYAVSEEVRKKLFIKYSNRSANKNLSVLKELLIQRQQMANLLKYKTYAAYRVDDRMAKNPETIWKFENNLIEKVKMKAKVDYEELLQVKKTYLKDNKITTVNAWERSFYNDILLKEKYQVDNEKVKEYFELNKVVSGLFGITQHLFDLTFNEVQKPSVWHPDVRMFEVKRENVLIGYFYLDLHPRPDKYTHAACFPMQNARFTSKGRQLPVASLVCNFTKATPEKPALLPHTEVITFFHEFGHVLHHILSNAELSAQAGFSVKQDFVEAPSQIFENWAWNYEALKLFARHYKTNELLPKEIYQKMIAARNVGSGLDASRQILYGVLDMTLHDTYNPNGNESTTDIVKRLQNEILLYPYLEGTNMQAAFGHLNGYGASYYGYLWSQVYAEDMFSVFEQKGIMDKQIGRRYRDIILAKGATEEEIDLVKQFLGREPNEKAFLKSLGL